jgi:epsilon-lactone hydrolase
MTSEPADPVLTPAPSPQFSKVLGALRRNPMPIGSVPLDQLRVRFEASSFRVAPDVRISANQIGGVAAEILTAPGARPDRTVVYLHGGGYVMGSPSSHRRLAGEVSRACGARVIVADYPLAPEHPFPAAIDALTGFYGVLLDSGISPHRLALAGDSAGGGLAVATLVSARARGWPMPAGCVTISAYADPGGNEAYSPELVAADPIVTPETIARTRAWYMGSADPRAELAAVTRADLTGLPPLLIQVGGAELLLADSLRLAQRARACGVPVTLEVWPHMVHVWHAFAGRVPEATSAVRRVGEFLSEVLDSGELPDEEECRCHPQPSPITARAGAPGTTRRISPDPARTTRAR